MSLKAGIIGMPNVGKSTIFNSITNNQILAANYPFATIDPNIGVVSVPDKRLFVLKKMYEPLKTIPTTVEFIDIAGLVSGASKGEGLGNKFLSHIREVDAIIQVIRCFKDDDIIHVEGNVNPKRDIDIINLELTLSDLEIVENRITKIEKKAKTTNDKESLFELSTLKKAKEYLDKNEALRNVSFSKEELEVLKVFNFITLKPIIYLANISEEDIVENNNEYINEISTYVGSENLILICAKLESELINLNEEEKLEFLKELNINETGLDKLIKKTYEILGLKTFFTVGKDECRAWTFKVGMKAPECAGIIHTDFQKGFIKAEVMSYNDLITYGNEQKVKENGKLRIEGKDYIMQDGDICYFRFNVTK